YAHSRTTPTLSLFPTRRSSDLMLAAWTENRLSTTPLRETLDRQSGIYRIAAKISDKQIDDVVGNFCKSDGGCLRTILWKRDTHGDRKSTRLNSSHVKISYAVFC